MSAITLDEGEDLAIRFTREPAGDLTPTVEGYAFDISDYVSVELPDSNAVTKADFTDYTAIDYDGNGPAKPVEVDSFSLKGMTDSDAVVETQTRAIELVMGRLGHVSENSNSNTLIIGTAEDNLVEEDETFTLVIAKTPTPVQAQVGDKTVMISEETRITVTIQSDDAYYIEGYTQKAIVEGFTPTPPATTPAARAHEAGQYVIDFTKGGASPKEERLILEFYQDGRARLPLSQVTVDASSTPAGIQYISSGGDHLLVLPAGVAAKAVLNVSLKSTTASDGKATTMGADIAPPIGTTRESIGSGFGDSTNGVGTFNPDPSPDAADGGAYLEGAVDVDDGDITNVSIEFDEIQNANWGGGQVGFTSSDKKTLYESQGSTKNPNQNPVRTAKVKLSRPWHSSTPLEVVVASSSQSAVGLNAAQSGAVNNASATVSFAQNQQQQTIRVQTRGKGSATTNNPDTTAEGFITTTLTTTPTAASHSGLDTGTDTATVIRMDDNNVMAMASATITEGASTSITLAANGGAVTAPAGESYSVSATIADAAAPASASDSPLPLAGDVITIPGQDTTPEGTATGFTPSAAFTTNAITVKDDDYINGPRRVNITQLEVSPDNRGVSFQDSTAQTAIAATIADDDVGSIFVSTTPSRPTAGHQTFLNGGAGLVEGQGYPFYLILSKPHRIGATPGRGGGVPLKLRLAGLDNPTGFNQLDYAIQLARPTPGVTVAPNYGNVWGYGIEIDRQDTSDPNSPSVSVVPLLLVLKKDTDTETVNVPIRFGLQSTNGGALGWLGCNGVNDIVEPSGGAESGSHRGCYYIGSPNGTNAFEVVANLLDENQELNVSAVGDSDGDGVITISEGDDIAITLERLASTALTDSADGYSWDISHTISVKDLSPGLTAADFGDKIQIDYNGGVDNKADLPTASTSISNIKGFGGQTTTSGIELLLAKTGHGSAGSAKNTLIISTATDNAIEGDESFTLVFSPTPRTLDSTPTGQPLNIGGTAREIKVIIQSDDKVAVIGNTRTSITEAGPSATPAHVPGGLYPVIRRHRNLHQRPKLPHRLQPTLRDRGSASLVARAGRHKKIQSQPRHHRQHPRGQNRRK